MLKLTSLKMPQLYIDRSNSAPFACISGEIASSSVCLAATTTSRYADYIRRTSFSQSADLRCQILDCANLDAEAYLVDDLNYLRPVLSPDVGPTRIPGMREELAEILFTDLGDHGGQSPYLLVCHVFICPKGFH
jgi:hypothetical protein